MLKILWKRGENAPQEQFLLLSTIFFNLISDLYVKTRIRFSFRDKWLFKITDVEIVRVNCIVRFKNFRNVHANMVQTKFGEIQFKSS